MWHGCPLSRATGHVVHLRVSKTKSTQQHAGCIVSMDCKRIPVLNNMTRQDRSSTDLNNSSQQLTNAPLDGWMETFEKPFWLFQAKLKQSGFLHVPATRPDPQSKQNSSILILTLAFESLTRVVFMAQWALGGGGHTQAPYWFKNSLNTIGLACTAAFIHTLVWRFNT